jgi:hypothetical protein
MPATADRASVASYAQFPAELDRDWLGRMCHLSGADLAVIRRRTDPVTQLGYATQLVTVRAIGTFQPDPAAVPEPVVAAVVRQLGIDDLEVLAGYRDMPVRWRHTAEIRDRYGYRDFTGPDRFAFTVWLYRQAWADEVASSVLFRAAHRQLLARQILLPGQTVFARLVAAVGERATHRVHSRLARAVGPELRAQLDKLLVVPEGQRRSELDLLRRPPFTPTIAGLVRALDRLERVRALGTGGLDLSDVPAARVVALARYADQAWATALEEHRNGEWRYLEFLQVTSWITAGIFMREVPGGTRARHRSRPVDLPEHRYRPQRSERAGTFRSVVPRGPSPPASRLSEIQ